MAKNKTYEDFKNYVVDAAASRPKRRAELIKNISKGRAPIVYKGADIASQAIEGIKDTAKAILDPESYTQSSTGKNERRMELPRFQQDRDAIFQENVQALLGDDREQYSEGGVSLETLETLEALIAKGKIEAALKEEIKEEKNDSKKNNLQTLLERIQSGEIDATNIREDMGKKRGKKAEGGDIDNQMGSLMPTEEMHSMPDGTQMPGATHEEYEATMSTDEDMEDGYLDFILDEALEDEEETYLMEQLESNDKLSLIFDKVIDVATEFAGSGPVNGPGSGVSDSIPARLSDGEFVFTAKATEELGADNLEAIMREAEVQAEGRQQAAIGGYINVDRDDDTQIPIQTTESAKAQSNVQPVNRRKTVEQLEEEMLKSNPRRRYAVISG